MSALSEEVVRTLTKRRGDNRLVLPAVEVDKILADLGVPTSAVKAVPVPLRANRIHFSGAKRLPPDHPDAAGHPAVDADTPESIDPPPLEDEGFLLFRLDDAGVASDSEGAKEPPLVRVPFSFDWAPQTGVNGIGSGRNLRGKSSVLNVLMWSLSGRCPRFQPDVRRWIQRVEVDWTVGPERLRVAFDAQDGAAVGHVHKLGDVGAPDKHVLLGEFAAEDFEEVMANLMMTRLRLETIPVGLATKVAVHSWPTYTSAFVVRANQLDPIVGNEQTLGVRMLQMFVGTDWVPAQAAVTAARRGIDVERAAAGAKSQAAGDAVEGARQRAQSAAGDAAAALAALPVGTPDAAAMVRSATRASELTSLIQELETRLIVQSSFAGTVNQQLKSLKARLHTEHEHALATKFFHQMRPTACPRCTAEVTPERLDREPSQHQCSVCTNELNLEAFAADVIVAASASQETASERIAQSTLDTSAAMVEEEPRDEVEALEAAASEAKAAVSALRAEIGRLTAERNTAAAAAAEQGGRLALLDARRRLELDLARAEGAVFALGETSVVQLGETVDPTRAAVAEAAEAVLKQWVKDGQDPLLVTISADIERLAVSFGADSLSRFKLDGAANMSMLKGGERVTYSGITEGEKLRVKIATAIALVRHGYVEGVGRHPGLLILDSPAAEEMPEADLAIMVKALKSVAGEAEMQIFVATRNADPLIDLLPEPNRVVATGDDYLW